jgi:hypothetical protein
VEWLNGAVAFWLPRHKSDTYFEGNRIFVKATMWVSDPVRAMKTYIVSRDARHPSHPALWVRADWTVPTRAWFVGRLRKLFPPKISGHSLRAGGATELAEAGTAPELIKVAGRWSSDAFAWYIRRNPILLHDIIEARRA